MNNNSHNGKDNKVKNFVIMAYTLFKRSIISNKDAKIIESVESSNIKDINPGVCSLDNFLAFSNKTVEDAMIPRADIVAVRHDISFSDLLKIVNKKHHTRTLVYEDTLDNIIGFVHIKDLFIILSSKEEFNIKKLTRSPIISSTSMKLTDLLITMQRQRTHIAIVVDEYGGVDGMVTIEDIIEEIVGEIADEHDKNVDKDSYQMIDKNTIIANGRVEVEVLENLLNVKLKEEDDEFDTIGGLVLAKAGCMPSIGEKIDISNNVELEVIEADARTLKRVRLKLKK